MTENEVLKDLQNYQGILKAKTRINAGVNPKIALDAITQAIEVIQQYRAIGTIEEFKALKEKSVAKKAKWHPNPCAEDNRIPICPNCNTIMVRTEIFGRTIDEHCVSCGQAIDWSE